MSVREPVPVSQFAASHDFTAEILEYPFVRPWGSFITDGEKVTFLPDSFEGFVRLLIIN